MTNRSAFWNNTLGRRMSLRLEDVILRQLRWNQEIYGAWLQSYVTENTRWLDAGCGHRILPPDFDALERELLCKARLVVGSDVSADSLSRHKTLQLRTCASLGQLPFPDQSFDLVTCNMVVEHLPDPNATFREFERVLSPGGILLLHTPNIWNYAVILARLVKTVVPRNTLLRLIRWSEERQDADIFPTYYRANSRTSLTAALQSIGLSCERFELLVGPQPVCRFFAPLALCELLIMRATMWQPLRSFATTMLCSFRKNFQAQEARPDDLSPKLECSALAS
jgi:2-polyprenyl-3-methyl-5-hydroxy-6-metoxy-1,4-benzoquinol methylase